MTLDVVFDSGGLSAWAASRPPADVLDVLEVVARIGGVAVVPSAVIVEASTGHGARDARVNRRLEQSLIDLCTVDRARRAARLRFDAGRDVSAVDAIVVATAERSLQSVIVTSDPKDLRALVDVATGTNQLLVV